MNQQLLFRELSSLLDDYERQLDQFDRLLPDFPSGYLRIRNRNEKTHCYRISKHNGIKKEYPIATESPDGKRMLQMLLEKHIIRHGRPILRRNIKILRQLLPALRVYDPDLIVSNLSGTSSILPDRLYLPEQFNAGKWIADTMAGRYSTNPSHPEDLIHLTKRGIRVRSKSEVFWDDALSDANAIFRYDSALALKNGKVIYPDFLVFVPESRRLVIIEHFGRMDDPKYAMKNMRRLQEYADSGYILGHDVFFTMETREQPLSHAQIKAVMRQIGL